MTRIPMLVLWTNDAITLPVANVSAHCYHVEGSTRNLRSNVETAYTEFYKVTNRHYAQYDFIPQPGDLSTLQERLDKIPVTCTMKIKEIGIVHEYEGEFLRLFFKRYTLKKKFSTDRGLFKYADGKIKSVFAHTKVIYANLGVKFGGHKPSMLVLEKVNGSKELASYLPLLKDIIQVLQLEKNPLSKKVSEIIDIDIVQTPVFEYYKMTEE